jgi:hypothetical protein
MDTFAFAGPASQQPFVNTSGRRSAPVYLIEEDKAKSASCYRIGADGQIEEGFFLDFNHPVAMGKIALVLGEGEFFLGRDYTAGCIYETKQGRAYVRRASLSTVSLEGKKPFNVLRKQDDDSTARLVLVNSGLRPGVQLAEGFNALYAGTGGTATRIGWGKYETLVGIDKDQHLLVFYPDGNVGRIHYDGLKNLFNGEIQMLIPEEALEERLALVEQLMSTADSQDAERKQKLYLRWLGELASMIRMTKLFPELRQGIIRAVGRNVKSRFGGKFPTELHKLFTWALRTVGEREIPWWLAGEKESFSTLDHLGTHERKGPPADRLKKLSDRRQEDSELRNKMRGSSGGGNQKSGQGKKGGKSK